jgi:hypothetical protein
MAANQPARESAGETMNEFASRRGRDKAATAGAVGAAHRDYGDALRAGRDVALPQAADVAAHGASLAADRQTERPPGAAPPAGPAPAPGYVGHPGFAESLIPVWGSGREAVADLQDGDYAGAALNGALAASDLFLADSIANAVRKGGLYALKGAIGETAAKANWKKAVRPKLGDLGILDKYQHGHHWLIPQKGWGAKFPEVIKNHPLNIKGMPSREVHGRIHGRYKGQPRFNLLERLWHGTPAWSKVGTGSAIGHSVAGAEAGSEDQ